MDRREGLPDVEEDSAAFGEEISFVFNVRGKTVWESIDRHGTPSQDFLDATVDIR